MPGFTQLHLRHPHLPLSIHQGFNALRQQNYMFCDCILVINGQEFPVHRSILAAVSQYFKALFTINMKEKYSLRITLSGISTETFQSIVTFVYTGEICLNEKWITEIYDAAERFQLNDLRDLCHDYLINQMCSSNCIGIWKYARYYANSVLEKQAWTCMLVNFTEVKEKQEFLELNSSDVGSVLTSEQLRLNSKPADLLDAMGKWLSHNWNKDILGASLNHMLSHLTQHDIDVSLSKINSINPEFVREWLKKEICKQKPQMQKHKQVLVKSPLRSLITVGGYNKGLVKKCERYCEDTDSWQMTNWDLSKCEHFHWVGVIGLRLYAIAGHSLTKINCVLSRLTEQATQGLQTNALCTDWEYEVTLPHDCSAMRFCTMNDFIYGCGEIAGKRYGISRYDPSNGAWEVITEFHSDPIVFFEFFSYDNKLHILGGMNTCTEKATCTFESYNPHSNTWEVLNSMATMRYHFGAGILGDSLYAVGGYGKDNVLLSSVEKYCFVTQKWSATTFLSDPRASMACCGWRGGVYCVGGEVNSDHDSTGLVETNDAFKFDVHMGKWIEIDSISSSKIYSSIVLM